MTLLVSCDEYCFTYQGQHYLSERGQIFLKRYLEVFENVLLAVRTKVVETSEDLGHHSHIVDDERVKIVEIPFFQGPKQYLPLYFNVKKSAKNAVANCDIAILRLPSTTSFVIWHELKKKGIPYATEIVSDCVDLANSTDSILNKIFYKIWHNWQVNACNKAIGVACVTKEYLQKRYFSKVNNAVTSHYSSAEIHPDFYFQPRKFPEKERYTIVHISNQVQFNGGKGHNELIYVLKVLKERGYDIKLLFIGKDYFYSFSKLRQLASGCGVGDDIIFSGYVEQKQMRSLIQNSDVAVLPTKVEGLPRTVIEVMALGLPCITSPVSGNPELISKDYLIEYEDIMGMANMVEKLLTNKRLYEEASRNNYEKSIEYNSEVLNSRRTIFYKNIKNKIKVVNN